MERDERQRGGDEQRGAALARGRRGGRRVRHDAWWDWAQSAERITRRAVECVRLASIDGTHTCESNAVNEHNT